MAEMAVRHNCANLFSFAEKYVDRDTLAGMINIIRKNSFDGGRHMDRVRGMERESI